MVSSECQIVDERVLITAHISKINWVKFKGSNYLVEVLKTLFYLFVRGSCVDENTQFSSFLTTQSISVVLALVEMEELKLDDFLWLGISIIT
jgi:hypothetical protein